MGPPVEAFFLEHLARSTIGAYEFTVAVDREKDEFLGVVDLRVVRRRSNDADERSGTSVRRSRAPEESNNCAK